MGPILVVEDDDDIRELVADLLMEAGYEVATAANGQEALDYLRCGKARPRLVLLDLMMPILSGPELIEIMVADADLSSVPIVVVSAMADRGSAPGVDRFLRKPVSSDVLLDVAASYCKSA